MSFGKNLQFLRKMHNGMTQEELAEKLQVSRQTVSKWELDGAYPEVSKIVELCQIFSCSMDNLIREDMNESEEAYSGIRVETVAEFKYVRYVVISQEPEEDAMHHIQGWAASLGISDPQIIGWDFPFLSQEQINVFHMHGYVAAWILPEGMNLKEATAEVMCQKEQKYAVITIKDPFRAPFTLIPNGYKTLGTYMQINGLEHKEDKDNISCFEKIYELAGIQYMDVYILVK